MHLHELLGWDGPLTWRQWQAWQEAELTDRDRPSFELQALTAEVRRSWVKEPNKVDESTFAVKLARPMQLTAEEQEQARLLQIAQSKLAWGLRTGQSVLGDEEEIKIVD